MTDEAGNPVVVHARAAPGAVTTSHARLLIDHEKRARDLEPIEIFEDMLGGERAVDETRLAVGGLLHLGAGAREEAGVSRGDGSHGVAAGRLCVGDIELDTGARSVAQAGRRVELAAREFDLLHALMLNAGRVLSREQLEQHLYGWGQEVDSNAIEVHVHHLRRKLGAEAIRTIRGIGYTMRAAQ